MPSENRNKMLDYCNCTRDNWERGCENIIKTMLASSADTVIFPIQDLLVFGADTRMNTPGTAKENWQYRITEEQLIQIPVSKFRYLNKLYGRLNGITL
jgi:4-alpha-glucanotransferase